MQEGAWLVWIRGPKVLNVNVVVYTVGPSVARE